MEMALTLSLMLRWVSLYKENTKHFDKKGSLSIKIITDGKNYIQNITA